MLISVIASEVHWPVGKPTIQTIQYTNYLERKGWIIIAIFNKRGTSTFLIKSTNVLNYILSQQIIIQGDEVAHINSFINHISCTHVPILICSQMY